MVKQNLASQNGTKKRLAQFQAITEIQHWESVFKGTKSTFTIYSKYFMQYLGTETPAQFTAACKADPDKESNVIDAKLTAIYRQSTSKANQTAFAILSFLKSHKIKGLDIDTKALKVKGIRQGNYLSYENAQKIISKTDSPYAEIFDFMLHSGLGADEIGEIQLDKQIQAFIEQQRTNDKSYVRINMKARKGSSKPFYTLVPKDKVPKFPLNNKVIGGVRKGKPTNKKARGGTPVSPYDLRENWRRAAKKAKLWQAGMGPHVLMSVFESTAGMAGTNQAAIQMARGHRYVDKYGYARQAQNEEWTSQELQKYWNYAKPATSQQVRKLEEENKLLKESIIPTLIREKEEANRRYEELKESRLTGSGTAWASFTETDEMKQLRERMETIDKQLKALGA
jgi:hypothetical protein